MNQALLMYHSPIPKIGIYINNVKLLLILSIFSHSYQLDESIYNFRVVGWYCSFFNTTCVLQCLIWFCTVCGCPTKRTLGSYGDIKHYFNANFS